MQCRWSGNIDEKGKTELINILLVIYVYYLQSRDDSFIAFEYNRNLKRILESGLINEETKSFLNHHLKELKEIYEEENIYKNINSIKEKELLKKMETILEDK